MEILNFDAFAFSGAKDAHLRLSKYLPFRFAACKSELNWLWLYLFGTAGTFSSFS